MSNVPIGSLGDTVQPTTTPEIYNNLVTNIKSLSHPLPCLLHILFKINILLSYLILPYILGIITGIMPEFICVFVITSLLVLCDYWVVKNYTSTILAGIAWYYNVKDNGTYNPVHKRVKEDIFLNKNETQFFWIVLYSWPILWIFVILFTLSLFQIPYVVLSSVIFMGGFINLFNCIKCSKDKFDKFEVLHNKFATFMSRGP